MLVADLARFLGQLSELFRLIPGRLGRHAVFFGEPTVLLGILTTVPIVLLLGPVIGFFVGDWIDRKIHCYPWVTIIFIGLGFVASGRETVRLLKEVLKDDEASRKDKLSG